MVKPQCYFYGYGSYGLSMDPAFSSDRLSLLDRGVVYAIAHVRGGGDLGKPWHEDGRLLKKRNTFTDFIACAEALLEARYTSSDRLAIEGRSAGGLLVGAVVNLRPKLFSVALAGVPFVDALNSMLDASLPLTVGEYEEWGNPNDKPFYECIKSYAPYENVRAQAYPRMLNLPPRPERSAGVVGAGEMGCQATGAQDRRSCAAAQDQHGQRPLWLLRPIRVS